MLFILLNLRAETLRALSHPTH